MDIAPRIFSETRHTGSNSFSLFLLSAWINKRKGMKREKEKKRKKRERKR
jgi:hypothetical protein